MMGTACSGPSTRRVATVIAFAAVAAAMLMALQPVRSPDVWHHIKSGELVAQGGPARTDPFSCTAHGQRWIQYEWLAQRVIYEVWTLGGVAGLMLMQVAMIGLTAFLLFRAACLRAGRDSAADDALVKSAAAGLAVALAMCAASDRIFTRPELFSWAILAAWLVAQERLRAGQLRWIVAFPILTALWVNLHGAWPAGLALLGLLCGAETILLLAGRPAALSAKALIPLWAAFGLTLPATLLNPYGWHVWEVPFKLSQSDVVRASILEWQRPGWGDWLTLRNLGVVALLVGLVAALRAMKLRDWFVLLFFGALAFTARRHIAVAMLVTAPILAALLAAMWGRFTAKNAENGRNAGPNDGGRADNDVVRSEIRNQYSVISNPVPVAVIVACLLLAYIALGFRLERAGVGLKERAYPIAAAEFLVSNKLGGNMFNSYAYGNYLLYACYPHNHVFIDGRVDMYGERVVKLYDAVRLASQEWRSILAQYDITLCVLETTRATDEKLLRALCRDPAWALVFWNADSAIFLRRAPEREEFLRSARVWHYLPGQFDAEALRSPQALLLAAAEFRLKLDEDPGCMPAMYSLARVEALLGRDAEALSILKNALAIEPYNPLLHYELGTLLMGAKEMLPEAERAFRRAIALGGQQGSAHLALSVIRHRQKDLPGAIDEARAALKFSPDNWRVHWNLSVLYEEAGRIPEAVAEMEAVLKLQPSMPNATERLTSLRARAGGKTP